ncbi:hypothetical protein HanIR_Chr14g0672471 [Helianthus annuus]|nr:hypothetical protein HanIR_Chr14g0672471 [Helianthus annuus]
MSDTEMQTSVNGSNSLVDRTAGSIEQPNRSVGPTVRVVCSIGREARPVGQFKWIISSFEKDVFVYDGLNVLKFLRHYLKSLKCSYLSGRSIDRTGRSIGWLNRSVSHFSCKALVDSYSIGQHVRSNNIPRLDKFEND